VIYKGIKLDCGYRIDLLVEQTVVVEVKSVDGLHPIHDAQLITYLRLGGWPVGLIINFNATVLKDGLRRKVNNLVD
jgi:GxxExxY protein